MRHNKVSVFRAIDMAVKKLGIRNLDEVRDSFIEWVFEGELKIGSTITFEKKECKLTVEGFCTKAPSDMLYLLSMKINGRMIEPSQADFSQFGNGLTLDINEPMADSSNAYSYIDRLYGYFGSQGYKFSIQNGKIHFSQFENGEIEIAYKGLCIDDEGYPMVNDLHTDALSQYLVYMYTERRYIQGKTPEHIYRNVKRRWFELCLQARADDEMPNPLDMRILSGIWNNMLPLASLNNF